MSAETVPSDLDGTDYNLAIKIDFTPPNIVEAPENGTYEAQKDNLTLQWLFDDAFPLDYTLYEDGAIVDTDTWSNGVYVNYTVGLRDPVTVNYTMYIRDDSGYDNQSTTLLTFIDTTAPSISSPSDMTKEFMNAGSITWELDEYQDWDYPALYWIYRNGTQVSTGTWNSTHDEIAHDLADLELGKYNFTLLVSDTYNNNATDTVWVTVDDTTHPSISSPDDKEVSEGSGDVEIDWICSDLDPAEYKIQVDGVTQITEDWNGENITYSGSLLKGEWAITLILYDGSGNNASDTVVVTVVDTTSPVIEEIESTGFWTNGTTGNNITWTASDAYLDYFVVYVNGSLYEEGTYHAVSETVVVFLDQLNIGTYNVTIMVFDESGNYDAYTMWVTVMEPENPVIPMEIYLTVGLSAVIGVVLVSFFVLKKKGVP